MVSVDLVEDRGRDVELRFSVRDTGIGLSEGLISSIFESFTQEDASSKRKYGGIGLGLAISRSLVRLMGGEINVESKPGRGSIFFFNLKLKRQSMERRRYRLPSKELLKLKVLIAVKNTTMRKILSRYLESLSFILKAVSSVDEVFKQVEKISVISKAGYDLLIIDSTLPGIEGIRTLKEIKNEINIPIITLLAMFNRREISRYSESLYIDRTIIKPVNNTILFDTIMDIFGYKMRKRKWFSKTTSDKEVRLDSLRGAIILLVEDNEINLDVTVEFLKEKGLIVSTAENGKEAVKAVRNREKVFDAVLMDLHMPGMDGYDTTAKIREDKRFADLPIIAFTDDAVQGVQERIHSAGFNDYIAKPIDPVDLYFTLEKWIQPGTEPVKLTEEAEKSERNLADPFPELEGIDVNDGLYHAAMNRKLYEKLLLSFSNNNENVVSEIRNAVEKDDHEHAVRIAHTLKGVSGNIGAGDLQEVSEKLNNILRDGKWKRDELEVILNRLSGSLEIVLNSIREYKKEIFNKLPDKRENGTYSNILTSGVKQSLLMLMEYLKESNTEAKRCFEEIRGKPELFKIKKELSDFEISLNRYDFEDAVIQLNGILNKLGIKNGGGRDG